jgi:hypothetical protein
MGDEDGTGHIMALSQQSPAKSRANGWHRVRALNVVTTARLTGGRIWRPAIAQAHQRRDTVISASLQAAVVLLSGDRVEYGEARSRPLLSRTLLQPQPLRVVCRKNSSPSREITRMPRADGKVQPRPREG